MESEPCDHASSGAVQCSSLKKGEYVVINKRPCKVVFLTRYLTRKHGKAMLKYIGQDIFTGQQYDECHAPYSNFLQVPSVKQEDAQVVGISDDYVQLLFNEKTKVDVRVPDGNLGDDIRAIFEKDGKALVTILSACEEEAIVAVRACVGGD